ncbi:MAG: hypothetical protein M1837_007275 [Sclerophora amabilis]|nr:MAG: hypothetical protein M1837_007275 [Sclerophora amabilis]
MAGEHSLSTHDLRSAAVEYKRDKDHTAKWSLGEDSQSPGRRAQSHSGRPVQSRQKVNAAIRRVNGVDIARSSHKASTARRHEIVAGQTSADSSDRSDSDSIAEDKLSEGPATAPDADITYSFDAPRGPGRGSQILGMALAKAVEKFEGRETDKLIQEQYEVIGHESSAGGDGARKDALVPDEDDFELI